MSYTPKLNVTGEKQAEVEVEAPVVDETVKKIKKVKKEEK